MNPLQRAFTEGVVKVRNKTAGEVQVPIRRPDPRRPGRQQTIVLLIPGLGRRDLTVEATVEELRACGTLRGMTAPPTNILEVLPRDAVI